MICFVTNEIAPGRRGGIGFFLEEAIRLLEAEGVPTCLLLTGPQGDAVRTARGLRRLGMSGPVVRAADCGAGLAPSAFASPFHAASFQVATALEDLCARLPISMVEFIDLGGLGAAAVQLKRLAGAFPRQRLAVRAHGTAELIRACEGRLYAVRADLVTYLLERYAVRHADLLLASTPSVLEEYGSFYGRSGPGCVSPLPVRKLSEEPLPMRPVRRPPCSVLTVGSLQAQKGMDLFVRAALRLCERGLRDVRFVVMGRDLPGSPRWGSYARELECLVPDGLRDRFEFRVGYYSADEMLAAARECSFAVLASRWEAFCLVAHELRWLGTPLVLSPIGAFRDCFADGEDAAFSDGTVEGLAGVMAELLEGQRQLAGRGDVQGCYADGPRFAAAYREPATAAPAAGPPFAEEDPLVSVVVAPGEPAGDAERTVGSVLASSYRNLEVVVAGGAVSGGDGRVRRAAGAEGAEAWNAGLHEARGPLVCFLAAGAQVSERYVERAVRALQACPSAAYVGAVTCGHDGRVRRVPYGLDPVLVTLEDGTGLAGAVLRRDVLAGRGVEFRADAWPLHEWELGWQLAEQGLTGEVLPEVHLRTPRLAELPERWLLHLTQRMAELHPDLVRRHAADVLRANSIQTQGAGPAMVTDDWLMEHCRGLRLVRVGLKRCLREGPRAVIGHVLSKLTGRRRDA